MSGSNIVKIIISKSIMPYNRCWLELKKTPTLTYPVFKENRRFYRWSIVTGNNNCWSLHVTNPSSGFCGLILIISASVVIVRGRHIWGQPTLFVPNNTSKINLDVLVQSDIFKAGLFSLVDTNTSKLTSCATCLGPGCPPAFLNPHPMLLLCTFCPWNSVCCLCHNVPDGSITVRFV